MPKLTYNGKPLQFPGGGVLLIPNTPAPTPPAVIGTAVVGSTFKVG